MNFARIAAAGIAITVSILNLFWVPVQQIQIAPDPSLEGGKEQACVGICLLANRPIKPPQPYLFGILNDRGDHFEDEWARGVRATSFEFNWSRYELQEGVYDTRYIHEMRQLLKRLNERGWFVQMVPGIQYVPDWVYSNYPDAYYVNQFGDKFNPPPDADRSLRVINAPFNPQARQLIAGYIDRIFQDFDQSNPDLRFDSVRIGGSVQGELRYPPGDWGGRSNAYWAFDRYAQDPSVAGIPSKVAGWRPGIHPNPASIDVGQLLINPGFEETHPWLSPFGWSPDDEISADITNVDVHGGEQALQIRIELPHRIRQYVSVQPNTEYEVGGWLKSIEGEGFARIFVTQYDSQQKPVEGVNALKLEASQKGWTVVKSSFTTSGQTAFVKFEMDGDRPGEYHFDDVWLYRKGDGELPPRNVDIPAAFFQWYVQKLSDYQNWQIDLIRQYFDGQLDLIYPGKGLQTDQVTDAINNDLQGDGWSEGSRALYSAAFYERHLMSLESKQNIAVYLTGIDDPRAKDVNDHSPYPGEWSAARWLSFLASQHKLPIWGENSGQDNLEKMRLSIERMRENSFTGLMWGFESELYSGSADFASIDDYTNYIRQHQKLYRNYLPLCIY